MSLVFILLLPLAESSSRTGLGDAYDRNASYYDASGLPIRVFYGGSPNGKTIKAPLSIFARRNVHNEVPGTENKREKDWENWKQAQTPPAFRNHNLPTHGVFPHCIRLMATPPHKQSGYRQMGESLIDQWVQSEHFTLETDPAPGSSSPLHLCPSSTSSMIDSDCCYVIPGSGVKMVWTQEKLSVGPDDPLFTVIYNPSKILAYEDDRAEGSPSSPLVTLLRRDIVTHDGRKKGHPAFFFVRIEKVGNKYVPWRGPPDAPGGSVRPASPYIPLETTTESSQKQFSLGSGRSHSTSAGNAFTPCKRFIYGM